MDSFELNDRELEKINKLTRRKFSADELYAFPMVMCDNETDRDGERFSIKCLGELAELFVGKTGIFDHDVSSKEQTARIYATEVVTDPAKKTSGGESYTCLVGYAYMVRNDRSRDLIKEIEAGIKKEVSVSCSVKRRICSVCGKDRASHECRHRPGKIYSGKLCSTILDGATDAYEFSFVAIPAQKKAGVSKMCGAASECRAAREEAVSECKKALAARAAAMISLSVPELSRDAVKMLCSALDDDSLRELITKLSRPRRQYSHPKEQGDNKIQNTSYKL